MRKPTITIVTACYNRRNYLEETILSVLRQNLPGLRYIIIDGDSNDGSIEIIQKYQQDLHYWTSEPDQGQYQAINKGFQHGSGEIMGWLNSDDILFPGSLDSVIRLFSDCPEIQWLTGLSSNIDKDGFLYQSKAQFRYSRESFIMGPIRGIQQESTFWRRSLWEKAGGKLDEHYKLAADYELWCRFFEHAKLYHVNLPLGAFRRHGYQVTQHQRENYRQEVQEIRRKYRRRLSLAKRIRGKFEAMLERWLANTFIYPNTVAYNVQKGRYSLNL